MDKLSSVLPTVLHRRGIEKHATGALLVHRAKAWMTERLPHLEAFVRVLKVQDGVMHISCGHSVALQECQCVSAELLKYLRLECPFGNVNDVRISRE